MTDIVIELGEKLHVEEQNGGEGELVGDDVEKNLWAVVLVRLLGALLRLYGLEAHLKNVGTVTEEYCVFACGNPAVSYV